MREYTTTDNNRIRKTGREKKIFFNRNGEAYFLWNGRMEKLENIMRLSYPIMYEDERGKLGVIGGYITISNTYGVLVELSECCETVQLWEEIHA